MDAAVFPAPAATQWMQSHTSSHLESKERLGFSMGIRMLGGSGLLTTRSTAQTLLGVVFGVASSASDAFVMRLMACSWYYHE
jgi:hypothetical protein